MILDNIDDLIDIVKARPSGTASGPLDKNKYVAKKVPVQRNGKTVMVTKYFDPMQSKESSPAKKPSGDSGASSGGQASAQPPIPKIEAEYKNGDLVKIISDSIGAVVQNVTKDSKKNQFVLRLITEKGTDVELYEKDVERVTSETESERITKDSIINSLKADCDSINVDSSFAAKRKILSDCLIASKNGITNVLVYGESNVGKNKMISSILSSAGVRKNADTQKIDKVLSLSKLDLSKIKDDDSLLEFLENNSKSLILVKDKGDNVVKYKKIFKNAIDRTLINIDFSGFFIFSVDVELAGVPEEVKSYCLCVDMNMSKEIKKSFLLVELFDIDSTNEDEKFEIIKSLFFNENIEKSDSYEMPKDCILIDCNEYEQISGKEISDSTVFEELEFGGKKVYKIKIKN